LRRRRQGAEIDLRQVEGCRRHDLLHRAVRRLGEAGAQRLLAADDPAEGAAQRRGLQPAGAAGTPTGRL